MSSYILIFFEGILAFISPCILPLLPVYLAHLGADTSHGLKTRFIKTLAFVLGFSTVFILLGAGASAVGGLLNQYRDLIFRLGGVFMVFMGFVYLDFITLNIKSNQKAVKSGSIVENYIFGLSYALAWTPCVGVFLGSALVLASSSETLYQGIGLLASFSLGLGVPFIVFSLLYEKLKSLTNFLNKNAKTIKTLGGVLLIVVGLSMIFDVIGIYFNLFL